MLGSLDPATVVRDLDEAVEGIEDYVYQQDNMHAQTRVSAWRRIRRAVADYKRLKRKTARQEKQIRELQATLRRLSHHGKPPSDEGRQL